VPAPCDVRTCGTYHLAKCVRHALVELTCGGVGAGDPRRRRCHLVVLREQPATGLQCLVEASEHLVTLGKVHQDKARVDQVVRALWERVGDDVVPLDAQVGAAARVEVARVEIRSVHASAGGGEVGEQTGNRAVASTYLQTPPTGPDADHREPLGCGSVIGVGDSLKLTIDERRTTECIRGHGTRMRGTAW